MTGAGVGVKVMRKASVVAGLTRVGISALEQRLNVDRSTISRWYRAGSFPAPHYVGQRRAWFLAEVEVWEVQRMARSPEERRTPRNPLSGR